MSKLNTYFFLNKTNGEIFSGHFVEKIISFMAADDKFIHLSTVKGVKKIRNYVITAKRNNGQTYTTPMKGVDEANAKENWKAMSEDDSFVSIKYIDFP